ncbi:MAG: excinuclease ABC subunit UvrC [Ruminococcaceae bacterium]|nr:excinuclease ABC subunit UvrC [Oscillospiraceae bacterium]
MASLNELRQRANELPMSPGVYLMKDKNDKIIYVGKSKVLKNRVSQYFKENGHTDFKTQKMVSNVDHFDYILTHTEIEALSLENRLIKLHKPKYNILLKDDKSYPYIKVTTGDEYPRIQFVRKRSSDKAKYFGPYSGATTAYSIIRTAQRSFGIPRCSKVFPRDIGKGRPCLYYQLGQCQGVCTGKVDKEYYRSTVKDLLSFLGGSFGEVKKSLTDKMNYASENLLFEMAAQYRDAIKELDTLWQKQKVVGAPDAEYDIISLYSDDVSSCLAVFYVRDGCVIDSEKFVFGADQIISDETVVGFLCDLYTKREYIARNILVGFEINEESKELLSEFLCEKADHKVYIKFPERGDLKSLCNMVYENARQYAGQYKADTERDNKTLIKLASMLSLEVVPEHIEAYDISNFGNDNITGGMISVRGGKFCRKEYRTYKIRGNYGAQDDYASMRETIERRLSHTESPYPDLILLDGGKGHVSTIKALLAELNIDIPVFGMVKDSYHKTRALTTEDEEISIAREQAVFQLVYKIQEEVHRFTINAMSGAKSKTLTHSSLERIDGIGPAKAKNLLSYFKTISNIKKASVEELACAKGVSRTDAQRIYEFYSKKEEDDL